MHGSMGRVYATGMYRSIGHACEISEVSSQIFCLIETALGVESLGGNFKPLALSFLHIKFTHVPQN